MEKYKDIDTLVDFTALNKKWQKERQEEIKRKKEKREHIFMAIIFIICFLLFELIEFCL